MVRSPTIASFPGPAALTCFDLKVMVGYFCTSRKLGLRRSLSRISTRVSTEFASIETSTVFLVGSAVLYVADPLTFINAPRTVDTPRCRTENCAAEWLGSICHVPACAAAAAAIARRTERRDMIRDICEFFFSKE